LPQLNFNIADPQNPQRQTPPFYSKNADISPYLSSKNSMLDDLKKLDSEIEREKMSFYSLKKSIERKNSDA
jgi:hypothetical protein